MGFNKYPYINYSDINLDWVISEVKRVISSNESLIIEVSALKNYVREHLPEEVKSELKKLLSERELNAVITEAVSEWLDEHPEATTTVVDGAITLKKINNSLKPAIQKAKAKMTKNISLTSTSSNAKVSMHYGYDTRGRDAIDEMLLDLKEMGVEEIYPIVNINLDSNNNHYISVGTSYLEDVCYMQRYAVSIGLICKLVRIMGKPEASTRSSYLTQLQTAIDALKDNFTEMIVLNERETLLEDDPDFGIECLNKAKLANMKASISITNRLVLSNELLNECDFISYNLYQPVQFNTEKIVYSDCTAQLLRQYDIISHFKSFDKPLILSECGCRDCYWSLGNPAGSTVPVGYDVRTNGKANAYLLDGLYSAFGNDVDNIAEWYNQGFNYNDDEASSIESRNRNKAVIAKWRGVESL